VCKHSGNASLFSPNIVEACENVVSGAIGSKARSAFVLMLIDCFEHYKSSVHVDFFRAGFPNLRRKANARNFRGAALLHMAESHHTQTPLVFPVNRKGVDRFSSKIAQKLFHHKRAKSAVS